MNKLQIRLLNRAQARRAFFTANAADFPVASPGGRTAAQIGAAVAEIERIAAVQTSGAFSRSVALKDERFAELKKLMRQIDRAADAMGDEVEGIEKLFRLPRAVRRSVADGGAGVLPRFGGHRQRV